MAQVTISIEDIAGMPENRKAKLVTVSGQLDESNVDERAKEIYDAINKAAAGLWLIFDFSKLEYMNSKSIGYLTDWYTKLSEHKGGIVIAGARPNIVDILQVVGITQLIKTVDGVAAAKTAIMK